MRKLIGFSLLLAGSAGFLLAGNIAPEIDPSSGVAALALLSGGLVVLRSRRRS